MSQKEEDKSRFRIILNRIFFFFPFQLLLIQLKRNHLLLLFWVILFAAITENLASKYGIPILFLYPEYAGDVSVLSHLILGFACGTFIMAYNISTYIIVGHKFPVIATLSRPFMKFCLNNNIIPLTFIIVYVFNMYDIQIHRELESPEKVMMHIGGFLLGNLIFILLSVFYFISTNKSIFFFLNKQQNQANEEGDKPEDSSLLSDVFHKKKAWSKATGRTYQWVIQTYLSSPFKISLARSSKHYKDDILVNVFSQNHANASIFEVAVIIAILILGIYNDTPILNIPASASIFLFFTLLMMIASAMYSWLKGWAISVFILGFLLVNFISHGNFEYYRNDIYGLSYNKDRVPYPPNNQKSDLNNVKKQIDNDYKHGIAILNNWKKKIVGNDTTQKPPIIFISTTGGGLRSALWTIRSIQYTDQLLSGELLNHAHMISGSSGGMIGAALIREIFLQSQQSDSIDLYDDQWMNKMGQDILNPIALNLVIRDMYFKFRKVKIGEHHYTRDRGYAFEKQLNENTGYLLDKKLMDYSNAEFNSTIPMMLFTPTVVNDGRKLMISAQPVAHLAHNLTFNNINNRPINEYVDFMKMFENQGSEDVNFTSVLRINATFPYILPTASLPTKPLIKVMDSGVRDNFGTVNIYKYIYTFREWLENNVSQIIILELRDKFKEQETRLKPTGTLLENMSSPLGSFYMNWTNIQTFEQDQLVQFAESWMSTPVDILSLQLHNEGQHKISLSWHLTKKEKKQIENAVNHPKNQTAIYELMKKVHGMN